MAISCKGRVNDDPTAVLRTDLPHHACRVFTGLRVGVGTHRRRATFERCLVFVGGVRLGVWAVVLVVCVCVCVGVGGVVLRRCLCVCVCGLLIFLQAFTL